MKVTETCSCGAKVELTDDSIYTSAVERLVKKWRAIHAPHYISNTQSTEPKPPTEQPIFDDYDHVLSCVCDTRNGSFSLDCPIHGNEGE